MDEYTRLTTLNAIMRGWAEYYKHTSLLEDIEEISRFTWFRYLQWLLRKHKGSRKHQLITDKTRVIHQRTRWTAKISEKGNTLEAYQWMPTSKELKRRYYGQKGREGFPHPYLTDQEPDPNYPMWEAGPDESIYSVVIWATSREEPVEMKELMLRAKMRDGWKCTQCGSTENLHVHHAKGMKSRRLKDLRTLCFTCHQAEHGHRQKPINPMESRMR